MLIEMMRGHPMSEVTSSVPDDLRILDVDIKWNRTKGEVVFVVESADFDDVPDGGMLPDWTPTYTARRSELDAILDLVRPDS